MTQTNQPTTDHTQDDAQLTAVLHEQAQLNKAIHFATDRHATQLRKGTTLPYILHPLETLQILSNMNADTTLQIAGLLHDTLEDTDATLEEITDQFGPEVADLVNRHSEDKSKSWLIRKTQAIEELKAADHTFKMLVLADKLSNLRSIARDYAALGDNLWARFNAPMEKQAWYYSGVLDALADLQQCEDTAEAYWELTNHYKDVFVVYKITPSYDRIYQANACGQAFCLTRGNPQWMPVVYRFRQNDIPLSRQEAETLEDKWYDLFLNVVESDLQDGSYPLFQSASDRLTITLRDARLTMQTANRAYILNEDDTYQLLTQLRMIHGAAQPLAQLLIQAFGHEHGDDEFRAICAQSGIQC